MCVSLLVHMILKKIKFNKVSFLKIFFYIKAKTQN